MLTRRRFLQAGAAKGGGLLVGLVLPGSASTAVTQQPRDVAPNEAPPYRDLPNIPAWVPTRASEVKSVSLNLNKSVDPCPQRNCSWSGTEGILVDSADNGCSYNADDGALGCVVAAAQGGHVAYYGTEVRTYDIATRLWSLRNQPVPIPVVASQASNGSIWNANNVDINGQVWPSKYPGVPAASHVYYFQQPWPKKFGGGPKGSTVLLGQGSIAMGGGVQTRWAAYAWDHSTTSRGVGAGWRLLAPAVPPQRADIVGPHPTWHDTKRGCWWRMEDMDDVMAKLDPANLAIGWKQKYWYGKQTSLGLPFWSYSVGCYCPTLDRLVLFRATAGWPDGNENYFRIYTWDPANPGVWEGPHPYTGYTRGDFHDQADIGWCDHPTIMSFHIYTARNGPVISYLKPPAKLGGAWTLTRERFDVVGDKFINPEAMGIASRPDRRMIWIPGASCFHWFPQSGLPVQALRPAATV